MVANHPQTSLVSRPSMRLTVIVYNKTRLLAGHQFEVEIASHETIAHLKLQIERATSVPVDAQWIVFGVNALSDEQIVADCGLHNGYTIYCTPTTVEIPNMPNL